MGIKKIMNDAVMDRLRLAKEFAAEDMNKLKADFHLFHNKIIDVVELRKIKQKINLDAIKLDLSEDQTLRSMFNTSMQEILEMIRRGALEKDIYERWQKRAMASGYHQQRFDAQKSIEKQVQYSKFMTQLLYQVMLEREMHRRELSKLSKREFMDEIKHQQELNQETFKERTDAVRELNARTMEIKHENLEVHRQKKMEMYQKWLAAQKGKRVDFYEHKDDLASKVHEFYEVKLTKAKSKLEDVREIFVDRSDDAYKRIEANVEKIYGKKEVAHELREQTVVERKDNVEERVVEFIERIDDTQQNVREIVDEKFVSRMNQSLGLAAFAVQHTAHIQSLGRVFADAKREGEPVKYSDVAVDGTKKVS
jgi:hypothetical protein